MGDKIGLSDHVFWLFGLENIVHDSFLCFNSFKIKINDKSNTGLLSQIQTVKQVYRKKKYSCISFSDCSHNITTDEFIVYPSRPFFMFTGYVGLLHTHSYLYTSMVFWTVSKPTFLYTSMDCFENTWSLCFLAGRSHHFMFSQGFKTSSPV